MNETITFDANAYRYMKHAKKQAIIGKHVVLRENKLKNIKAGTIGIVRASFTPLWDVTIELQDGSLIMAMERNIEKLATDSINL